MITDISEYTIYELAELKGEEVRFCRYKYYDSDFNEGFVLVSDYSSFFFRVETKIVDGKYDVHFLIIKAFQNIEIDEAFSFSTITKGKLKDIIFLNSTVKGMIVDNNPVQDIVTESSALIELDSDSRILIYPDQKIFSSTGYEQETDSILDLILSKKLTKSRQVKKDITALQYSQ